LSGALSQDLLLKGLTPEEELAYYNAPHKLAPFSARGALSQVVTNLGPDPSLPGPLGYIPLAGGVENLIGAAGAITNAGDDALRWGLGKIGLGGAIPQPPPFSGTSAAHADATKQQVYEQIGGTEPTNEAEAMAKAQGEGAGMMAPLATPAAVAALPKFAQWILPTASHAPLNVPIGAGLATASEAVNQAEAATEQPQEAQQPALPSFADYIKQDVQVAQNTTPGVATDAPTLPTFADYVKQPDAPTSFVDYLRQGAKEPPGPTFDELGYSDRTLGQDLLTIGGALVGVAAAAFTHRIGAAMTDAGRTARFNDPVYAAKAQDYNNSVIARGGADINAPKVEPPLPQPNVLRTGTNYTNTQLLDENARMMQAIQHTADPLVGERLANMYGNIHSDAVLDEKLGAFLRTGHDPVSGLTIANPRDLDFKISKLTPERYDVWNRAQQALDEMDNRRNNAADGTPGPHNFKNQTDADLARDIAAGRADPFISDIIDHYNAISKGMMDIGKARNFFMPSEYDKLLARHPNYVAEVGPTGEIMHPIGSRDATSFTGVDQINSKAHYNAAQHIEQLYRQFDLNDFNQQLWQSQKDTQRLFPNSAQFMSEVPSPVDVKQTYFAGVHGAARDPIVRIRTAAGPKYVRVDHPDFFNAMTSDSLMKRRIISEMISVPRRWYQRTVTGPLAMVGGKVYATVNPVYTGLTMGVNAPSNRAGGLLDKGLRAVTGRSSSITRGIDMATTNLPGVAYSYGRGVTDRWIQRFGDWIHPAARNPINDLLRSTLTDAQVDTIHEAARDFYKRTRTAQMAEMGIGGLGQGYPTDLPRVQAGSDKTARLVSAHLVPDAFLENKWLGIKPVIIKLNKAINEAFTHLGDAGNEYYARLNWNEGIKDRGTFGREVRGLTGDPAVHGKGPTAQTIAAVIPFSNIAAQGTARLFKSIGQRPFQAPMTAAIGLGSIALLSIMSHMRSPEHLAFLQNEVSLQQREANAIFAASDDPHKPVMVPLPQEFRAAYAFMLDVVSKLVNITAMQHDPATARPMMQVLKDFFGSHVTNSTDDAMTHGAVDLLGIVNLPPYAGQVDLNKVVHGDPLHHPLTAVREAYSPPIRAHELNLPNQASEGVLDDKDGKVWSSIFSSFFGIMGTAMVDATGGLSRYAAQTKDWDTALGMVGHDWVQGFHDKNPQFNLLWENAIRLSTQPPIVEQTDRALKELDKIGGSRAAIGGEGFTGRGHSPLPVPQGGGEKLPQDPAMMQMYNLAEAYKTRLAPQREEIANIRKQMGAVQNQGMNPQARREWLNARTRDVADKYRFVDAMVSDLNAGLSKLAGVPMRIEQFARGNMHGDVSQFK